MRPSDSKLIWPDFVSASGSVISSGANELIAEIAPAADATVTRPAPARYAAIPAIAAAPGLVLDPATTRTWPYWPLFEFFGRGANNRAISASVVSLVVSSGLDSQRASGLPMGTTWRVPIHS